MASVNRHFGDFLTELSKAVCVTGYDQELQHMLACLKEIRQRSGRLFIIGLGGGAANASHAVNDFRKLCGIEAYCPTDNVSEFSARVNDEGLDTVFYEWLDGCRAGPDDAVLFFSVGGGSGMISRSIIRAVELANDRRMTVLGVVGKKDGAVATKGNCVIVTPSVPPRWLTPITEALQMAVLHALVSHPELQINPTRW